MRKVSIEHLQPGMKVARTVYTLNGTVLLAAGSPLTANNIERLKELHIVSIFIDDELSSTGPVRDIVTEEMRQETARLVRESIACLEEGRQLNIRGFETLIAELIEELLGCEDLLVSLSDVRAYDDHIFNHSVNVGILSLLVGISLSLTQDQLRELGMGAFLHDVGKMKIMKDVLDKPGILTPDEYEHVKNHSELGFDLLRHYLDIPLLATHVAFQHHERWDGLGYPRGLSGEQIHEYARIVSTTDIFDALMADRPYRPAYSANQATIIVNRLSNNQLEPRIVAALISHVAVFPIGSIVCLSTGELGVVMEIKHNYPHRPIIRVIYDHNRKKLKNPHLVDLSRFSTIHITRLVTEREIRDLSDSF